MVPLRILVRDGGIESQDAPPSAIYEGETTPIGDNIEENAHDLLQADRAERLFGPYDGFRAARDVFDQAQLQWNTT
jgi:hypothetical protein